MKKGSLNFLGRKNQSLFDTNIKMRDMDSVELVLGSSATPESGTASVRARPTVKHHASSSDSFQGFAVPTPKVPLLPPVNGPKINGSVGGDQLSNGSVVSVPDLDEGEIFVPPPPSMAPPPPPSVLIPPPPDFLGDLDSLDPATLQPPSMPAPKPPSMELSMKEEDLSFLKPPPMAPPKPPSTCSTGSASSIPISNPPPAKVPEHPKFAVPQPPTERQQKTHKTPPPKPIRISSVTSLDSPPQTPAPPPPVQAATLSTFNPQNTAKLYSAPKTSLLTGFEDHEKKPKQMLLLEDSGSVNSVPMLVEVNGNASKGATPSKPVPNDAHELKDSLQITQPSESPLPAQNTEVKMETISAQPEITNSVPPPPQKSPQLEKVNSTQMNLEPSKDKPGGYRSPNQKFSPLLDHKLRSLKGSETNGPREGHAASPLALLMAAKEREKHRSTQSLSRENSAKKNDQPSIHPSDTLRSGSSVVKSTEEILQESPKSFSSIQRPQTNYAPVNSSSPAPVNGQIPSTSPAVNGIIATPTLTNPVEQRQNADQSCSQSQSAQPEDNKEEFNMPLLPPPPEFDDLNKIMELPPSIRPPDPPTKKAPPPVSSLSPASVPSYLSKTLPTVSPTSSGSVPSSPPKNTPPASVPAPPLKTAPPAPPLKTAPPASVPAPPLKTAPPASVPAPPLNPPPPNVQPKPQIQTKAKPDPAQSTRTLEQRHFDLQCILKKKLEEMAPKMSHQKEDAEPSSDEWEANDQLKPPTTNYRHKAATLDMRELQRKVDKKYQDNTSTKGSTSNGQKSKHQHGMTFTVRPGTKNPITYYE